jgi:membrane protein implicated in regulation of membrane protease activity
MSMWIWLVAAGILLLIELLTADLLFASLALAALSAMIASGVGAPLLVQGVVFSVVAVVSLALLRPIALRHLRKPPPDAATNIDALLGRDALVLEEVTRDAGQVKLAGEVWTARTREGQHSAGARVRVVEIDGAIAIVEDSK